MFCSNIVFREIQFVGQSDDWHAGHLISKGVTYQTDSGLKTWDKHEHKGHSHGAAQLFQVRGNRVMSSTSSHQMKPLNHFASGEKGL
jgi:hypothetical protein